MSARVSLDDCFKKFTQEEVMDGDEKPVRIAVLILTSFLLYRKYKA